ncbi:MAG: PPC domain-containing protein, partial [Trichodesmium sp. MO_231.B1]|nr:PPC domain-containing protein [Trichodesmium sp. MO_231.B1]
MSNRVYSVKKFDANGSLLDTVSIGEGGSLTAKFAGLPNSDSFIGLREDGMLMLIDPDPLSVDFLDNLHLRSLEGVENNPYYITGGIGVPSNLVDLSNSKYNDIAVRQNGEFLDLFITGIDSIPLGGDGTRPFVMRLQVGSDFTDVIEAQVLMSGWIGHGQSTLIDPLVKLSIGPGIAVNTEGTVLTSLPTIEGNTAYAYPDLVAFPADFEPTDLLDGDPSNDPIVLPDGVGIDSLGMTADDAGNFYVLDSNHPNSTSVVVFPPTLEQRSSEEVLGSSSKILSRGDIAVDSMNQKAYVTFNQEFTKPVNPLIPDSPGIPVVSGTVMTFDAAPEPVLLELPPELIYVLPHITYDVLPEFISISGVLEEEDSVLEDNRLFDLFPFYVSEGQQVTFNLDSDEFDTSLAILTPDNQVLEINDNISSDNPNSEIVTSLPTGPYIVIAHASDESGQGAYRLTIQESTSEPVPELSPEFILYVNGVLEEGDLVLEGDSVADVLTFDGSEGQEVTLNLDSDEFDTVLAILNDEDFLEINDDVSSDNSNSEIVTSLPTDGRYAVIAHASDESGRGSYRLTIQESTSEPEPQPQPDEPQPDEPEPQPEEPEPDEPEPQPDEPEPDEPKPQPEPEPEPEPQPEPDPEPQPEPDPEPQPEPDPEPQPEP